MGSLDYPFNPLSLALGAEATFVARTHDMDRDHMIDTFKRANAHHGAAFVEVLQNCNVFNDGAWETITKKDVRESMMITLTHGEPIRFGPDKSRGVTVGSDGQARIVEVADVGEERILVHDEEREDPALAFMLSRLSSGPHEPTPIGVFRDVNRTEYAEAASRQLAMAQERSGPGDLSKLLRSGATWVVE
jgi:2-oxoglutarate ferredoxin oxidoreductase subunit beta